MHHTGRILIALALPFVLSHGVFSKEEISSRPIDIQMTTATKTSKTKVAASDSLKSILATVKDSEKPEMRSEALSKLKDLSLKKIPSAVTEQLTKSVLLDESEEVRKAAASSMKALDDKLAMSFIYKAALAPNVSDKVRKNAGKGLRRLDNAKLVEALVSVVTYVFRIGKVSELTAPQTIYITNGLNVDSPQGSINLPIELPNVEISYTATALAVHALRALRVISRRDLGRDPAVWQKWFDKWKHIHAIRNKQKK